MHCSVFNSCAAAVRRTNWSILFSQKLCLVNNVLMLPFLHNYLSNVTAAPQIKIPKEPIKLSKGSILLNHHWPQMTKYANNTSRSSCGVTQSHLILCQIENLERLKTGSWVNEKRQQCVFLHIKATMVISWLVIGGWAAPGSVGIWTTLLGYTGQVRHAASGRLPAKLDWKCTASILALVPCSSHYINLWMLLWKNGI